DALVSELAHLALVRPPSPTRRSSDLGGARAGGRGRWLGARGRARRGADAGDVDRGRAGAVGAGAGRGVRAVVSRADDPAPRGRRSEEHTSELQSRENLVCRLLLEQKK